MTETETEGLGLQDLDQMIEETLSNIVDADVGITNTSVGSVVRTIVEAILSNVDETNYYLSYVYDALSIDDAIGDDLDRLVAILGLTRRPATVSTGIVTFSTGGEPAEYDIPIPYGYEVSTRQASDGSVTTYTVLDEDCVLKAGESEIDVTVQAEEAGHKYLPAGSLCIMGTSIIGIQSVINKEEVNSGVDKESDDDFRTRTKEYVNAFGKGTNAALKAAVEGVDGVTNCTVDDLHDGIGTSAVIVVPDTIPVIDSVDKAVKEAVAETKAAGIKVSVIYPTIKYTDIDVTITGVDNIDNNVVVEAISTYANSLHVGQTFVIKQMERKVLNIIDTNIVENDGIDIRTNAPLENVVCEPEEIIRVRKVTINGEEVTND